MSLSRLQNLYRNLRGRTIYVDQSSLDATDSIENTGTSPLKPFLTIQRALIEVIRYSYQAGRNNDRFGATTVKVAAGVYEVDNRPGYIFKEDGTFLKRSGESITDLVQFDLNSNFDLTSSSNDLYKLNSIYSGIILPRGVSLIGEDYRKCVIRPKYVPNPRNANIEAGAIFRLTGANYITDFTVLDADPNTNAYKDYTTNLFVPSFSHHKLRVFEYVDGVNDINIKDDFITYSTSRTDLEMYYQKVALAYGESSGRPISPDYPSVVELEPISEEFNIVGSIGTEVGITSIRAGDGIVSTNVITVTTDSNLENINVDTSITISGVNVPGYDGQFVVFGVPASNQVQYRTENPPVTPNPSPVGAILSVNIDTVNSASPYISNCALRSVYGMCGILCDGAKVDGFKSIVIERFTGISLQKDESAYVKYNTSTGTYLDSTSLVNLQKDSRSRYKPEYSNFHCKVDNDAFIQLVSVFCIGYSDQIICENGGDFSVSSSNSTFGSKALVANGYKKDAFERDNQGYVTHIISPKEIEESEITVEFSAIDVEKTVGIASTNRLYLYEQTDVDFPPSDVVSGYRIGAKQNETLNVIISQNGVLSEYSARVIMNGTEYTSKEFSSEKSYTVGRSLAGINSISSNTFTLTENHTFSTGEKIRVFSENGHLPDGVKNTEVYYAITYPTDLALSANQVKISHTLSDAGNNNPIVVNQKGGVLTIVSRVSDKSPGETGHPVQYDQQWYVNVATAATENTIYSAVVGLGTTNLGDATPRTFVTRTPTLRSSGDSIYKLRYVIPKSAPVSARPPIEGYVIQESNTSIGSTNAETVKFFNPSVVTLSSVSELRKLSTIAKASWSGGVADFITEIPHNLSVGSVVETNKIISSNNSTGVGNSGFNAIGPVVGINSTKHFSLEIEENPGTFTNNTSARDNNLPTFARKDYSTVYYVYKVDEKQAYVENSQDGIYELTVINASNSPTVTPFKDYKFSQPLNNLYPEVDKDNVVSDPQAAKCFATSEIIGNVVVNNAKNSITKETIQKSFLDQNIGIGLTNIQSSSGIAHTFYTKLDHGLSGITSVSISNAGSGYIDGSYYNTSLVGFAGSTTGQNATAVVTINSGVVSSIKIMDGGSAYGIGNTLSVLGIGTTGSGAVVQVSRLTDNLNDSFYLFGDKDYSTLYKINNITVGKIKEFTASSSTVVPNFSLSGIGSTVAAEASIVFTGKTIGISTIFYDGATGITTIGFSTSHGYSLGTKFRLSGATDPIFNNELIVNRINSLSIIETKTETSQTATPDGTLTAYNHGLSSQGGISRFIPQYAGITTTLTGQVLVNASEATPFIVSSAFALGLNPGDYLSINDEIVRVRQSVIDNNIYVFRAVCGTNRQTHSAGSVIRKIKVTPIEFRRNSIIKASNHTFEYVGFGAGNYSSALPANQDRVLSIQEEILAQTTRQNGGAISVNATNSEGSSYVGNKKTNTNTGEELIYDFPSQLITGEEENNVVSNSTNTDKVIAQKSIKVEGGQNKNIISEFNGPVVFNNKIISTSDIEANTFFLQGNQKTSRRFTLSDVQPTISGGYGDICYNANPAKLDFIGWTYTTQNEWEPFGFVGGSGVGISSNGQYVGFTTYINLETSGINLTAVTNDVSGGITTVRFDADPRVAITTGALAQNLVGMVTTINFVGALVNVTGSPSGIATINISPVSFGGSIPGLPYNSIQFNANGEFSGVPITYYDEVDSNLHFGAYPNILNTLTVTNDGRVGFSSYLPTAKLEINADNETSLYIKSTSGSNIVRIDNISDDTTPFIIDQNGRIGINTSTTIADLDVVGSAAITGQLKFYDSDRTNYVSFASTDLASDFEYILPTTFGSTDQVLSVDGVGNLSWNTVSRQLINVSTGLTTVNETSGGITTTTISNTGVIKIIAGVGMTVTPVNGQGEVTVEALPNNKSLYPYTTIGFNMPM